MEKDKEIAGKLRAQDLPSGGNDFDIMCKNGEGEASEKHYEFINRHWKDAGGFIYIDPTTKRTQLKQEIGSDDAQAREAIAGVKGTAKFDDPVPVDLTSVKTELIARKIKTAANGKNTTVKIDAAGVLTIDAEGGGGEADTDARKEIAIAKGTANYSDAPAISLKDTKAALDGIATDYKIKNAINGKNTSVRIENGNLIVDASGGGGGSVKSVNLQEPDGYGNVTVKAEHIKDAQAVTVQQRLTDLDTYTRHLGNTKEDVSNKVNEIKIASEDMALLNLRNDTVSYPSVTAVTSYVSSKIIAFSTIIHDYITETLKSYYTKTEIDSSLLKKANVGDSYLKTESDAALLKKADVGVSYTKKESDDALALKADKATLDATVKAIINAMDINAKLIQGKKVDIAGIKDGQGIALKNDIFIPANIGGGTSDFNFYKKTVKMKYGETVYVNSKDIAGLKMNNFLVFINETEIPGIDHFCSIVAGQASEPSSQAFLTKYELIEGSDIIREVRLTKLTGRADVVSDVEIMILVYTGKALDLPIHEPKVAAEGHIAHIRGIMNLISENFVSDFGNIQRTGDDLELLNLPYIDPTWRKNTGYPCVVLKNDRTLDFIIQPRFVNGMPTIAISYTNPSGEGLLPEKSFKMAVEIGCASNTNKKLVSEFVRHEFDQKVNWSGNKDSIGYFEIIWPDQVDCRDMALLHIKITPMFTKASDTMDCISAKVIWKDLVFEREV